MLPPHISRKIAIALLAAAAAAAPWRTAETAPTGPGGIYRDLCAAAVSGQETRHGIPRRLLTAISLVEAGRWDAESGQSVAWPWTVTAQGKGRFFPTKAAAIAEVRRLRARGISSIDVGCMQVNLYYHPDAFRSLETAFDPVHNAAYAATFLTDLKRDKGSWQRAVQHYHSSTPAKRIPYQRKVYAAWRETAADAAADRDARDSAAEAARIRRISRQIERDHRIKLSAFRRGQARAGADSASDAPTDTPQFLSSWPPRDARAQFRAQNLARAWAFGGSARRIRP